VTPLVCAAWRRAGQTTAGVWAFLRKVAVLSHAERHQMVEQGCDALPLSIQAALLQISRSSLYDTPVSPSPEEVAIKHQIDELYTAHPLYGSRKLTVLLQEQFGPINRKRVQRSMREMGLAGIAPGPNLSKRLNNHRVYPYLLRGVVASAPNHIWGCDITYIRLRYGWLYLVAIIDWYSRFVVRWELDETLELPFVLTAIDRARTIATPSIWNTDQGSHFTSPQVTEPLLTAGVQMSMDGKGRATDTIFTERLWRSVKYEEVYLVDYANPREAREGIGRYFTFYNTERPHQALGYRRPCQLYTL
jgi:putative transposase